MSLAASPTRPQWVLRLQHALNPKRYRRPRRSRRIIYAVPLVFILVCASLYIGLQPNDGEPDAQYTFDAGADLSRDSKALVVPKTREDRIRWIVDIAETLGYTPVIYSMDTPPEKPFLVPRTTRGREVAAYLTYLVDFYDRLPAYTVFIHSGEEQWHNDLLGSKTSGLLESLRFAAVDSLGYVNLRCTEFPGCPTSVHPLDPTDIDIKNNDVRAHFAELYMELFQVGRKEDLPRHIGGTCCAQFAVTRERIRQRPKGDYERMLRWTAESKEVVPDSAVVGWVFEELWHLVFGMDAIHCPRPEQCRCDNYGWCGPLASGERLVPVG